MASLLILSSVKPEIAPLTSVYDQIDLKYDVFARHGMKQGKHRKLTLTFCQAFIIIGELANAIFAVSAGRMVNSNDEHSTRNKAQVFHPKNQVLSNQTLAEKISSGKRIKEAVS